MSSVRGGLGRAALLAVAASMLPSVAVGQVQVFNRYAYVGVGLGQGQGNVLGQGQSSYTGSLSPTWMEQQVAQNLGLPSGALAGTLGRSTHELDIGGKAFVGYRFHRYGAIEAGYSNLTLSRYFKMDYQGTGALSGTTLNGQYKADAWWVGLVGMLPIPVHPALSFYGKVGAAFTTARFDVPTSSGIQYESSTKARKTTPLLAVGAQYDFTPSLGARLEYESYGRIGDADTTGQVDARLVTLDVMYKH